MPPWILLLAAVGGYLLGSIPFGVIVTRLGGAGDVRQIGSGNIGATNVLRTGRKDLALLTLLGDGGKGAVAVLVARWLSGGDDTVVAIAAGAAFLGHLFPVWLRFRGGKGVATFLGIMLAAAPWAGVLCCLTWLGVAGLFRFSSLAALAAAALAPLYCLATDAAWPYLLLSLAMAMLVFIRHHANIARLLKGEEPRIGRKSTPAAPAPPA